ncbi:MAG TPA: sigma-70 family RNA polymerase sigma factor [Chthoniobacterales bacterium]
MIRFSQAFLRPGFEREILSHLDAAFSLARFLLRDDQDAEDAVQEASLRAFRFFDGFRGQNSRAWFLTIVRNSAYNILKHKHGHETDVAFDEQLHTPEPAPGSNVGSQLDSTLDRETIRSAIEQLVPEFREVITLRELEDCSYKEIADIAGVPIGTVMSRLARARTQLGEILSKIYRGEK